MASDSDSNVSEASDNEAETSYAAVRFYVKNKNEKVIIKPVSDIQDFDNAITAFPYYAFVKRDENEDGEYTFEPAVVLAVSTSYMELSSREKRWKVPNRRRTDVMIDLAKQAEEKTEIVQKTKPKKPTKPKKSPVCIISIEN